MTSYRVTSGNKKALFLSPLEKFTIDQPTALKACFCWGLIYWNVRPSGTSQLLSLSETKMIVSGGTYLRSKDGTILGTRYLPRKRNVFYLGIFHLLIDLILCGICTMCLWLKFSHSIKDFKCPILDTEISSASLRGNHLYLLTYLSRNIICILYMHPCQYPPFGHIHAYIHTY